MLFAFLSGGVVPNVAQEEYRPERESRFSALALGAGASPALLLSSDRREYRGVSVE